MTSEDAGSRPSPRASGEEVTRFAQRISRGERGKMEADDESLKARPMRSSRTCAIFEVRRWRRNCEESQY